ncbi:putative RNA-directed DNA polymerase from transposon X-element [Mycena venus]|uniref:Putative RNA-directed DNA polymerase from transposon X-element n=1 Tax=Mycena venus TaxID=2733690 RepID=A0A8H6Z4J4_9AGAR|nr:putative RNA-directed DNA polymerase from transposon X-element [Mycena venus]
MLLPSKNYVPCTAPVTPLQSLPFDMPVKVLCDIPEVPQRETATVPADKSDGMPTSYHYAAHRGRVLNRMVQQADLKRLTDASSNSAAFWKVYWSMADLKPREPAVSLADLATCFEKRMNAPQPLPPSFDKERLRVVEECAENIPLPSKSSPYPSLNRKVTEEDIEWAKDHLRLHYNTAIGLDRVHYRENMEIENSVLCKLINECVDRNDAPTVWFTTLIAAFPRKTNLSQRRGAIALLGLRVAFSNSCVCSFTSASTSG